MPFFRKRSITVEAIQWTGGNFECLDNFCGLNWGRADVKEADWLRSDDCEQVVIWNTSEKRWICCPVSWWIIRGLRGELYLCDPEIFAASYDPFMER